METDAVVELDDPLVRHAHHGPLVAVQRLGVGDYGVHVVVAAGELQHHKDRIFLRRGHFVCSCGNRSAGAECETVIVVMLSRASPCWLRQAYW